MKTAQQIEGDVRLALQQQIGGRQSGAAGPRAPLEHVLEHRRVRSAETHVPAFHRQIPAGGALQFLQVTGGVKPFQLVQRRRTRCDFESAFPAEQAEGFQPYPRQPGALGFERAIRRVTQPFRSPASKGRRGRDCSWKDGENANRTPDRSIGISPRAREERRCLASHCLFAFHGHLILSGAGLFLAGTSSGDQL